ncbi:MAG: acetylxylan esterase [Chloroflexi bacterium]|nr:acetylxylan esterase [Chloroflexota bacterium]
MKRNIIPQEHLSTMSYLWREYARAPRALAFRARTPNEFRAWRDALRGKLIELLGGFPSERCDLAPRVVEVVEEKEYRREKVIFYSEPEVAIPCYVLIPRKVALPYRAVIALHGHGTDGTRLMLGLARNAKERASMRAGKWDFARQLARRGFIVFAPAQRALGERVEKNRAYQAKSGRNKKSCTITTLASFMLGRTMAGMRVWDVMRTIDYLRTRAEPIAEKIGCMGWSGGGTTTLYASALDERISAVVLESAFCTYRASILSIEHCADNYIPGILRYAEASDIAGLIAPRPVLIESGTQDHIFPIAGVKQAYDELARVYAVLHRSDHLDADFFSGEHRVGGRKAFAWLARWLK